jgi:putative ABC transport system permease protein
MTLARWAAMLNRPDFGVRVTFTQHRLMSAMSLSCTGVTVCVSALLHISASTTVVSLKGELQTDFASIAVVRYEPSISSCRLSDIGCIRRPRRVMASAMTRLCALLAPSAYTKVVTGESVWRLRSGVSTVRLLATTHRWHTVQPIHIVSGRPFTHADERRRVPVVLIGQKLADSLFGPHLPSSISIHGMRFEVLGVASSGATAVVNVDRLAIIPLWVARRVMSNTAEPFVLVDTREQVGQEGGLYEALNLLRRLRPHEWAQLRVETAEDRLGDLARVESALESGIVRFSVLLACASGVCVAALIVTLARSRRRAIGIQRAVGATRASIVGEGVLASITIALLGAASGAILCLASVGIARMAYAVEPAGVVIGLTKATMPSLFVSICAGLIMFVRLSRESPAELLN